MGKNDYDRLVDSYRAEFSSIYDKKQFSSPNEYKQARSDFLRARTQFRDFCCPFTGEEIVKEGVFVKGLSKIMDSFYKKVQ